MGLPCVPSAPDRFEQIEPVSYLDPLVPPMETGLSTMYGSRINCGVKVSWLFSGVRVKNTRHIFIGFAHVYVPTLYRTLIDAHSALQL